MEIRKAYFEDIEQIVKIHILAFNGFFLTLMGEQFLKKYYEIVLSYKNNLTLVLIEKNKIQGFVTGFYRPNEFYSYFRSKRQRFIIPILIAIIKNPLLISRTVYNFKKVNNFNKEINQIELSSIAVHKEMQRKGIGKVLVNRFIKEAFNTNADRIYLTTDAENNISVNRFYLLNGFTLEKSFLSQNRLMNYYIYNLQI